MTIFELSTQQQINNTEMKTKQIINGQSQFYADLIKETKNFNGTNRGYYNLILSIRDLKLYESGMKPNRHWKISDVKTYFGIKGSATSMRKYLEEVLEAIKQN